MSGSESPLEMLLVAANEAAEKGDVERADSLFKQVVKKTEMKFGPESREFGQALFLLASFYKQQGRLKEAADLVNRSQEILARHRKSTI